MKNISDIKHLCAGCGVCAGMCKSISIDEDEIGHYHPVILDGCVKCGKCVSVCPEITLCSNDDVGFDISPQMKFDPVTGYYIACYDGFIENHRRDCASGGLCSELIVTLLKRKMIDAVYCAVSNPDSSRLYVCGRLTTEEDVRKNARSAYYPIEISDAVLSIRKSNEKVAIVCLPCQAKALRLAMKRDIKLKKNIKYIIGLVCGGIPGKAMVEYVAKTKGVTLNEINRITFREKDEGIKCNNCQIKGYHGDECGTLKFVSRYHGESFGFSYFNRFFHNASCWTCDDAFAEHADVVFGDAWYKENTPNILGTSICLTRNAEIDELIRDMGENVHHVEVSKIIEAQRNVSVVDKKKRLSAEYARIFRNQGYVVSNRIENHIGVKTKIKCRLYLWFYNHDVKLWHKYKNGQINFGQLDRHYHHSINLKERMHL